jgi:hypothetical protein
MIRQIALSKSDRDVLLVMAEHCDYNSIRCQETAPDLAWELDCSREHVLRAQKRLLASGLLVRVSDNRGGAGRAVAYELHPEFGDRKPPRESDPNCDVGGTDNGDRGGGTDNGDRGDKNSDRIQSPFATQNGDNSASLGAGLPGGTVTVGTDNGDRGDKNSDRIQSPQDAHSKIKDSRMGFDDSNRPSVAKKMGSFDRSGQGGHDNGGQQNGARPGLASNEAGDRTPSAYSPYLAAVVTDFSDEFGDSSHTVSNVTQVLRLWSGSGQPESDFVEVLYEAKRRTREYQGKQGARGIQNKMAYFFTVLRDLVQESLLVQGVGVEPALGEDRAPPEGLPISGAGATVGFST